MLVEYNRNTNYFKSIKTFKSIDFYNEFVNLNTYFNSKLILELENIKNMSLLSYPNKFMINIGNGNVGWVDIIDIIEKNTISLDKFQKIPINSIITSYKNDILPVQCNITYGIFFSPLKEAKTWSWDFLKNSDIKDKSITGDKIDLLEYINLSNDMLVDLITDNFINMDFLADNSISGEKIVKSNLNKELFEIPIDEVNTGFIPNSYSSNFSPDNNLFNLIETKAITPSILKDFTIEPCGNAYYFIVRGYSDNPEYLNRSLLYSSDLYDGFTAYEYYRTLTPYDQIPLASEVLESFNILPECLDDDHLIPYLNLGDLNNIPWYDNPNEPRYFQQGYIFPTEDCRVEGRCIPKGSLKLGHFDDTIRAALIAKGVTEND